MEELKRGGDSTREAEEIRATERERLRALVQRDSAVAQELHANDFQLISPAGNVLTREQYLRAIFSGEVEYRVWEPDTAIDVRLYGDAAVIRYRSRAEVFMRGIRAANKGAWHTDTYEKREGRWQAVWSQATGIQ